MIVQSAQFFYQFSGIFSEIFNIPLTKDLLSLIMGYRMYTRVYICDNGFKKRRRESIPVFPEHPLNQKEEPS